MPAYDISEVIARRTFSATRSDGSVVAVTVIIGKPEPIGNDEGYWCPYQVVGGGAEKVRKIGGVDAIQAIQLALRVIGTELEMISRSQGLRLNWEHASAEGDYGLV